MFWIGFTAGLLTPSALFGLWWLYSWLTQRNFQLTCKCGKTFGVLPSEIHWGWTKDNGEPYKRATLNRVTAWQHRWHWWFHCPARKAT